MSAADHKPGRRDQRKDGTSLPLHSPTGLPHPARAWRLDWDHGSAEVQALGGMLGPVTLRLDEQRDLDIMHVAHWFGTTDSLQLPGIMRRLRGEWPCVPFGRTDLPPGLPEGWQSRNAGDDWAHGYAANHEWTCEESSAHHVRLSIRYPDAGPIEKVERLIWVAPDAPALELELTVWPRRTLRLPAGLHPTFRLPPLPGRVRVELGPHDGIFSYPSQDAEASSLLLPDRRSERLETMAGPHGTVDLSCLPLDQATEELVQVRALRGLDGGAPFTLHYLDYNARIGMWWDQGQFPDLMLWMSNGGRPQFPWQGCHVALGAEPVNSLFDLGRVASAPPGHPLADRLGVQLEAGTPWRTRYRIAAFPTAPLDATNSAAPGG